MGGEAWGGPCPQPIDTYSKDARGLCSQRALQPQSSLAIRALLRSLASPRSPGWGSRSGQWEGKGWMSQRVPGRWCGQEEEKQGKASWQSPIRMQPGSWNYPSGVPSGSGFLMTHKGVVEGSELKAVGRGNGEGHNGEKGKDFLWSSCSQENVLLWGGGQEVQLDSRHQLQLALWPLRCGHSGWLTPGCPPSLLQGGLVEHSSFSAKLWMWASRKKCKGSLGLDFTA